MSVEKNGKLICCFKAKFSENIYELYTYTDDKYEVFYNRAETNYISSKWIKEYVHKNFKSGIWVKVDKGLEFPMKIRIPKNIVTKNRIYEVDRKIEEDNKYYSIKWFDEDKGDFVSTNCYYIDDIISYLNDGIWVKISNDHDLTKRFVDDDNEDVEEELEEQVVYRYFISYSYTKKGSFGNRNTEFHVSREIESIEDIRALSKSISEDNDFDDNSVVILNYHLFKD